MFSNFDRFLRKKIVNKSTLNSPIITDLCTCGDVNGDNVVDILDYLLVLRSMGRYVTDNRDLDGDGRVTQKDLDIVIKNFGLRGD